jgi:hypothetical protein
MAIHPVRLGQVGIAEFSESRLDVSVAVPDTIQTPFSEWMIEYSDTTIPHSGPFAYYVTQSPEVRNAAIVWSIRIRKNEK